MPRTAARMIIRLCDWMMGYHGKIIYDAIYIGAMTAVTVTGITAMFLTLC